MTSQERVVRQPPQYGGFEDTQEELDWYGSNPEGIDRDRPLPEVLSEDDMALLQEKDESDPSDAEWSRGTYSDASRSPSPPFNTLPIFYHPPIKRKASVSLDKQKEPRKGTKRSKLAPVIPSKVGLITESYPETINPYRIIPLITELYPYIKI
ncbi:hypothetical protein HO173_013243 [Letharia columbiana]|uniref:Uncharacterized protein n=1 Tax=Letharia columbiana TaxID=112416 RepID=A0A8H6CGM1_9LECA|nr:uncharacterized protein HO173_013243 [Letharia columbiana]KAF6223168.1 hypothetical protein HO173_013243 [Letharia columbiana]